MEKVAEVMLEPRKQWAAPELKKIDIEQITAHHVRGAHDGPNPGGTR